MGELEESIKEGIEKAGEWPLNSAIAILVALTATVMALCHIKDENVVQKMEHAQAHAIDTWSYYQAKSTKQHLAENMVDQARMQRALAGAHADPQVAAALEEADRRYAAQVKKYEGEKTEIQKQAEELGQEYDHHKARHDEFSIADACLAISIALYGMTALTRKRWLLWVAVALSLCGLLFVMAGFVGWEFHPAWLAKLLT